MIIAFIRSSSFLLLLFSGSGAFQPRPLGLSRSQQTSKINYIEDEKATEVEVLKTTKQKKLTVEEDESSIWPVETPYHRAVDCTVDAEIECDIDEISRLASKLMELDDDECTIEVPPDGDCTDELDARAHLTKALQAKRDLKELEQSIRTNDFVVALKEGREEDWKNHWYNDYMDYYYM